MSVEDLWKVGRGKQLVNARSLLCYWTVRELGFSMTSMARMLSISTVAVSKSVQRGAEIATKEGYSLK
jgi:predicted transcriptional regulator